MTIQTTVPPWDGNPEGNRMKKIISAAAIAALALGGVLAIGGAASATTPATECVPSEAYIEDVPDIQHAAVGEPTITVDNPEYVPGVEATTKWWNFAPNKDQGPLEGEPAFPLDERGTWEGPHTEGGPGQDQTGTYLEGEGNASWFHRENTPAVEPVGEPTIEIPNPDYAAPYVEVTPDIEHPAVTCDDDPVVVAPLACLAVGDWYTESDDLAPVASPEGLVFQGGSGKAVGIRVPASGNLQGWAPVSFTATGGTEQFFFRIVIDASADGGPAYKSLSFPGYTTVDSSSVSYQYGESIAATAERFPNAVVTSVGFQTNSGAPADYAAVLSSATGCATVDFTYTEEPPVEEPPVVTPPVVTPTVTAAPAAADLAETGGTNPAPFLAAGILALVAGGILVAFQRRHAAR